MATLKHIASKNSDYSAVEAYLIYQHDAFTGKQLLDEQGKPKLRESYLLNTLKCGDFSFATACLLANRKYGNRFLQCCTAPRALKIFPTGSCSSTALPSRKVADALSYLPAGRTKFIRAKHLGDKFDKAAVLATLQANAERKPKAQFKQDTHRETDRHPVEDDRGQGHRL